MDDSNNILYRLINEEIDGTISPDDLRKLRSILVDSEEARVIYGRFRQTVDIIKTAEEVAPPPDLKAGIMRSIDADRYSRARKKSIFDTLRPYVLGYRAGFALSFAGGVLCGALILALYAGIFHSPSAFDKNILTGTIISEAPSENLDNIIKDEHFNRADVSGSFRVVRTEGIVRTEVNISGGSPVTYTVKFDPNVFSPIEISTAPKYISENRLEVDDKGITIRNIDAGDFGITFKKISEGKSSIDFLVKSGTSDNVVYTSSLALD